MSSIDIASLDVQNCDQSTEKLKESFLFLKKKLCLSHELIKQYSDKVKECDQVREDLKSYKEEALRTKCKLRSAVIELEQKNAEYEKKIGDLSKTVEDRETKISADQQYLQQLLCKIKDLETQQVTTSKTDTPLKEKIKALEHELKTSNKQHNAEVNKLETKLSKLENENKTKGCKQASSNPRLHDDANVKTSDKSTLTNDFYSIRDDAYPLFCAKCQERFYPAPLEEILNQMSSCPAMVTEVPSPPKKSRGIDNSESWGDFRVPDYGNKRDVRESNSCVRQSRCTNSPGVSYVQLEKLEYRLNRLERKQRSQKKKLKRQSRCCGLPYSFQSTWPGPYAGILPSDRKIFQYQQKMLEFERSQRRSVKRKWSRSNGFGDSNRSESPRKRHKTRDSTSEWHIDSIADDDTRKTNSKASRIKELFSDNALIKSSTPEVKNIRNNVKKTASKKQRHTRHPPSPSEEHGYSGISDSNLLRSPRISDDSDREYPESDVNASDSSSDESGPTPRPKSNATASDSPVTNSFRSVTPVVDVPTPVSSVATSTASLSPPLTRLDSKTTTELPKENETRKGTQNGAPLQRMATRSRARTLVGKLRNLKNKINPIAVKPMRKSISDIVVDKPKENVAKRAEILEEVPNFVVPRKRRIAHRVSKVVTDDDMEINTPGAEASTPSDKRSEKLIEDDDTLMKNIAEVATIIARVTDETNDKVDAMNRSSSEVTMTNDDTTDEMREENADAITDDSPEVPLSNDLLEDTSSTKKDFPTENDSEITKTEDAVADEMKLGTAKDEANIATIEESPKTESPRTETLKRLPIQPVMALLKNTGVRVARKRLESVEGGSMRIRCPEPVKVASSLADDDEPLFDRLNATSSPFCGPEDATTTMSPKMKRKSPSRDISENVIEKLDNCVVDSPPSPVECHPRITDDVDSMEASREDCLDSNSEIGDATEEAKPRKKSRSKLENSSPNSVRELRFRKIVVNNVIEAPVAPTDEDEKTDEGFSPKDLLRRYLGEKGKNRKYPGSSKEVSAKFRQKKADAVTNELKRLIDDESWSSATLLDVTEKLKKFKSHTVVRCTIDFMSETALDCEPLNHEHSPPAPLLTKTQQRLLTMIVTLNKTDPSIIQLVQAGIEYRIFRLNCTPELKVVEELTRILVALARIQKDREKLRILCCDALYCLGIKAIPMIYTILSNWAEVLPMATENNEPLLVCIVHVLLNQQYAGTVSRLVPLKQLLTRYYEYKAGVSTSIALMSNFMSVLEEKRVNGLDTAVILLAKREGCNFAYKNVVQGGLLRMIIQKTHPSTYHAFCLLGHIMRTLPVKDEQGSVGTIVDQLVDLLEAGEGSAEQQEGAAAALLSLGRHKSNVVSNCVMNWNPVVPLSRYTLEQLNSLFDLCPPFRLKKVLATGNF